MLLLSFRVGRDCTYAWFRAVSRDARSVSLFFRSVSLRSFASLFRLVRLALIRRRAFSFTCVLFNHNGSVFVSLCAFAHLLRLCALARFGGARLAYNGAAFARFVRGSRWRGLLRLLIVSETTFAHYFMGVASLFLSKARFARYMRDPLRSLFVGIASFPLDALALLCSLLARLALEGLASLTGCEAAFARYLWGSLRSLFLRLASPANCETRFARCLRGFELL